MKRKNLIAYPVLALIAFLVYGLVTANAQPGRNPTSVVMQAKLAHCQDVLEGLTLGDFNKIQLAANQLGALSLEAGWNVIQTEEYREQSRLFRRETADLAKAAQAQSVDRSTLAYLRLTMRCVECHRDMRERPVQTIRGN